MMDEITKNLKEKIKKEIKKAEPYYIIISFIISIKMIQILMELHYNTGLNDTLINIIAIGGIILAIVKSISFRALLLVLISIIYYIAKSLIYIFIIFPQKLLNKYDSLDEKNKKIIKTVTVFAASILAKKFLNNIINSELKGSEKGDYSFVNPHEVNGYTRKDGKVVNSYWRDGDGNPLTNLTKESGGGYIRKK